MADSRDFVNTTKSQSFFATRSFFPRDAVPAQQTALFSVVKKYFQALSENRDNTDYLFNQLKVMKFLVAQDDSFDQLSYKNFKASGIHVTEKQFEEVFDYLKAFKKEAFQEENKHAQSSPTFCRSRIFATPNETPAAIMPLALTRAPSLRNGS